MIILIQLFSWVIITQPQFNILCCCFKAKNYEISYMLTKPFFDDINFVYFLYFSLSIPLYIDSGGSWSDWSSWSSCSQTCNGGRRSRTRACEDGADCEGSNIDIEQCNTQACASEWLEICRLPHLILQTQLSIAIHVHCQFHHIIHCTWTTLMQ